MVAGLGAVGCCLPPAGRALGRPLLVETPSPARYYLGSAVRWQRWSSTWAITLPNGHTFGKSHGVTSPGVPNDYTRLINQGFFVLVALNSATTPGLDREITEAMQDSHRYRLVTSVRTTQAPTSATTPSGNVQTFGGLVSAVAAPAVIATGPCPPQPPGDAERNPTHGERSRS